LMSLFWYLMNGSADCVNVLIGEANISQLANFHHSLLFARENLIAQNDFLHPCIWFWKGNITHNFTMKNRKLQSRRYRLSVISRDSDFDRWQWEMNINDCLDWSDGTRMA
jgi:hypothetical protein